MEEELIQRVHGIDRHKRSATISVMDREGKEIKFIRSCGDLNSYIQTLGSEDSVVFVPATSRQNAIIAVFREVAPLIGRFVVTP